MRSRKVKASDTASQVAAASQKAAPFGAGGAAGAAERLDATWADYPHNPDGSVTFKLRVARAMDVRSFAEKMADTAIWQQLWAKTFQRMLAFTLPGWDLR